MTILRIGAPAALLALTASAPALGVEFHGYFRSGIGASRGGTDQVCFRAEGSIAKYRLGNECETYVELALSQEVRDGKKQGATDTYYKVNTRWAFVTNGARDWEPSSAQQGATGGLTGQELTTSLREVYGEAINVFAPGTSAWVGKRFYRRHDIHILDYYFVETAGPGAGVENIDAGIGKLHLAALRNVPTAGGVETGPAQTNIDLRLSDIGVGGGSLQPIFIYGAAGERDAVTGLKAYEKVSGWQLSLLHSQPGIAGGDNTFVVQYGKGLFGGSAGGRSSLLTSYGGWGSQNVAKGDTKTKEALDASSTLRVIDQLVISPSDSLSAAFVVIYQSVGFGGAKDAFGKDVEAKTETTFGTRPVVGLTENVDLAFEYGYTQVGNAIAKADPAKGKTEYEKSVLHKATIAPQISPAGFWGRPQLRLFATYAKWNDESKGLIGAPVYGKETSGFSTGAQVEAWW